jgi:aryl-alcohol dehydrogenase-like predicted oxidoreductase
MQTRPLGRTGIEVSPLGLGTWALGGPFWAGDTPLGWGETDDAESLRVLDAALDAGITLFDTADAYGTGHAERLLARAVAGRRDRVVIATKWGNTIAEEQRQLTGVDASPAYVRTALDASLRRLDTDWIDLYLLHLSDLPVAEAQDLIAVLEDLVDEGKIRSYGWSSDDAGRVASWAGQRGCAGTEFELNVLNDASDLVALCEAHALLGLCRGPLAMGLLGGRYRADTQVADGDVRGRRAPEWMRWFHDGRPTPEAIARISALREVLTSDGRTLAQGALAWIWARSPALVPIPGARTVDQLIDNAGALQKGPLTPAQMGDVERLLSTDAAGPRRD